MPAHLCLSVRHKKQPRTSQRKLNFTETRDAMLYRIFTGNCGKVMGNNTAVYQAT